MTALVADRPQCGGKLFLVPSSINTGEITRIFHDGYDVGLLSKGFHALGRKLGLDAVLVDTHPGVNEETLLSMAISDVLVIVLRPDQQDYQGTMVAVEVARKLGVPSLKLMVNKAPGRWMQRRCGRRSRDLWLPGCGRAAALGRHDAAGERRPVYRRYPDTR